MGFWFALRTTASLSLELLTELRLQRRLGGDGERRLRDPTDGRRHGQDSSSLWERLEGLRRGKGDVDSVCGTREPHPQARLQHHQRQAL